MHENKTEKKNKPKKAEKNAISQNNTVSNNATLSKQIKLYIKLFKQQLDRYLKRIYLIFSFVHSYWLNKFTHTKSMCTFIYNLIRTAYDACMVCLFWIYLYV